MTYECDKRYDDCRWRDRAAYKVGCHLVRHHVYYPKSAYQTDLEILFRELGSNREVYCKHEEELLHEQQPPPDKPPAIDMATRVVAEDYAELEPSDRLRMIGHLLDKHAWQLKLIKLEAPLPPPSLETP